MKRKAGDGETAASTNGRGKKVATKANAVHNNFGDGLFTPETVASYAAEYAKSQPYKHAVVSGLINDTLLRSVREEILANLHFTPKETDIYKIHQSGDLANLDGLPASALEKLPSLLKLRDSLYSEDFRRWISEVSGAGPVSGKKTDMAVNVYVPGCHLLCHDDVIGSRRVSYILYLTDPDKPWKAEWGGALRLYPTDEAEGDDGKRYKIPSPKWSKVIPPAWNQLSFFAVQPGESFHDVEEVYKGVEDDDRDDGGRFRMAISGWFHIPQEGEDGYEPGLEEKLAKQSSLQQLQGKADRLDLPPLINCDPKVLLEASDTDPLTTELSESDLEFLLKYMTPNYLTPDTVEELHEMFADESMLQLSNFLNPKFADRLRESLHDRKDGLTRLRDSRPPHKHRYQWSGSQVSALAVPRPYENDPWELVLDYLLPSLPFRKWLALATGLTLKQSSVVARRFRRGLDYELAQSYDGEDPQLEYCLCVTPSTGWGGDDDNGSQENGDAGRMNEEAHDEDGVGGYEMYMAGDDNDDEDSDDGVEIPAKATQSHTGAGDRRNAKRRKADPAIYKAADDDEDDGILVSNVPSWNTLSVVLRDRGTLKFVKYVSQSAPGDRWDFSGVVEVEPDDEASEVDE